jgi:DNA helicase-2/ATP-dependent DNA helicase PcrA
MAEPSIPSRFLSEIPRERTERLGGAAPAAREVDLYADRYVVREAARKNTYTGKTYNSLENISEFFAARGRPLAVPPAAVPVAAAPRVSAPARPVKKYAVGSSIEHPRYGRGTIVRREGDGDDAKITISFPGYGLKKIVEKYLGLTHE